MTSAALMPWVFVLLIGIWIVPPAQAKTAAPPVKMSTGRAIIPGTWEWDLENNALASCTPDFWWERYDDKESRLVPVPGVKVALLEDKDYDAVDYAFLKAFEFPEKNAEFVNHGDTLALHQGAVLAVRTSQGHLAKIVVRSYHKSDDRALGEPVLEPLVKILALKNPALKNFHLEVEWTLFDSPSNPPERLTVSTTECAGKKNGPHERGPANGTGPDGAASSPSGDIKGPDTRNFGGSGIVHF